MTKVDGYKYSFPIIAGKPNSDRTKIELTSVLGTAFSIGNGFFITAGHVIKGYLIMDIGIGITSIGNPWHLATIIDLEIKEEIDIAILKTNYAPDSSLKWENKILDALSTIIISGYPHAILNNNIYRRDFKGYIITCRKYTNLSASPLVYEISMPCPRGISGSFILNDESIYGIVIGSDKTAIDLRYEVEERIESGQKYIHHLTETSTYGIVISSVDILSCPFSLLGGPLIMHLTNLGLILS